LQKIIAGVRQFHETEFPPRRAMFEHLAARQQEPIALFITCSDSRIMPSLITSTEAGDLFLVRNAGNIVPPFGAGWGGEVATIEYSLSVLHIANIIICGHSQCGAIAAMMEKHDLSDRPGLQAWIQHASATRHIVARKYPHLTGAQRQLVAAQENVLVQMNNLSTHPLVASRLIAGELRLAGWYYDIATGVVLQYNQATGRFEDLDETHAGVTPFPTLAP
jgi:carbonic anhydrase